MPSSAEAVWQKGSDALSHILRLFPSSADTGDVNGKIPLHLSCMCGNVGNIGNLLKAGANVNSLDSLGLTPLHCPCGPLGLKSVHLLIRNKASVNAVARDGTIPLHIAAIYGQEKTVGALLENGADVNLQNAQGASALHCLRAVVANGQREVVDVLIATGCVNKDCKDRFERTPLSWVRRTGNAQMMKLLTEGSQRNGALTGENESVVEKEPLQNIEVSRWCDVCTVGIPKGDAYHGCGVCNQGDFDICAECSEIGAHCLEESHRWIVKMDGEAMR
ncbi:ankyrin repeat-containing domain protein [Fusarium tricinctum]|uniref:Ankyrin repeat-containing domain protein n=1 Tax=Fusarium tricinctum TaxID=61284 RepID=A0A8K0RMY2_9HYPO|nr:ankyrin repeat-containing domain protein [Fusarium tricinctum]